MFIGTASPFSLTEVTSTSSEKPTSSVINVGLDTLVTALVIYPNFLFPLPTESSFILHQSSSTMAGGDDCDKRLAEEVQGGPARRRPTLVGKNLFIYS